MSIYPTWTNNLSMLMTDIQNAEKLSKTKPTLLGTKTLKETREKIKKFILDSNLTYTSPFFEPVYHYLSQNFEEKEFNLINNPNSNKYQLAHDSAQAILQRSDDSPAEVKTSIIALQRVVCDIWNTFVSASRVCPKDNCLPPIVKWGKNGAYTFHTHSISILKTGNDCVPIISFPSGYANGGILGWTILGHETAHTVLESIPGLTQEIANNIIQNLYFHEPKVIEYWGTRVSEAAADVMEIMYMGPIAAVGLITFFRSLNQGKLRNTIDWKNPLDPNPDKKGDPHPADIFRAILAASVIYYLPIKDNYNTYYNLLTDIKNDFDYKLIGYSWESICRSILIVAHSIMKSSNSSLGGRSLANIRCWGEG